MCVPPYTPSICYQLLRGVSVFVGKWRQREAKGVLPRFNHLVIRLKRVQF